MKQIAALLTVHNRKEKTLACLSCLFSQKIPADYVVEVYLTDDGCTDGTAEAVKALSPEGHIIQGDGKLYWNRGMYVAWEAASKSDYDYYLWLNDDTNLYPNALLSLIEASCDKEDKAIIIGATQDAAHTKTTYGGRLKSGKVAPVNGQNQTVHHFNGNIVLVPCAVFKVLGNLDWYFTHSKGDFDYGLRANKNGIEMFQVGHYLGECENHPTVDKWCNPNVPFKERWEAMWRPNGMPPHETFHLEKRHIGIFFASFHYVTILIRCIFPRLWLKR